jgi:hypothetical protein
MFGKVTGMKTFKWSAGSKCYSLQLMLSVAWSAVLLCLTGCASVPKPPSHLPAWTPVNKTSGDPIISGRYQDTGSGFSKDGKYLGQFSLTSVLQKEDPKPATNDDVVVVIGPENSSLEVQSWRNNQMASMIHWTNCTTLSSSNYGNIYNSSHGFVWMPLLLSTEGGPFLLAFEDSERSLFLRKAEDGSLIIYNRDFEAGEILFVPIYKNHSKWYRFKPVLPNP